MARPVEQRIDCSGNAGMMALNVTGCPVVLDRTGLLLSARASSEIGRFIANGLYFMGINGPLDPRLLETKERK